ncbi:hypothetical protein B0H10DRAFT_2214605 [Mycena sp. CBHHK59/15]|nr:hypothetical protein B0H10DRAFT_2214605 [Mycena sp. CBHHK59/15]
MAKVSLTFVLVVGILARSFHALRLFDVGDVLPQCLDVCTTYNDVVNGFQDTDDVPTTLACGCSPANITVVENCYDCSSFNNQTQQDRLQRFLDNIVDICNDHNLDTKATASITSQKIVPGSAGSTASPSGSTGSGGKNTASRGVGFSVPVVLMAMLASVLVL